MRRGFRARGRSSWFASSLLLLASIGQGCAVQSQEEASPAAAVVTEKPLATELPNMPNATERAQAERAAAAAVRDGKLPRDVLGRDNARLLLLLAALPTDNKVTVLALRALRDAYAPRATSHKAAVDANFVAVVNARLTSSEPSVQGAALQAARAALGSPDADATLWRNVRAIGSDDATPSARYSVLEAMKSAHHRLFDAATIEELFQTTQRPEAHFACAALDVLNHAAPAVEWTKERVSLLTGTLARHADAGVRGQVFAVLRRLENKGPEVLAAVRAGLRDTHAYVRSEAAKTAGALRLKETLAELIPLLEDRAGTRYALEGFGTLDGRPGRLVFGRGAGTQVRSHALESIAELSEGAVVLEGGARTNRPEFDRDVITAKTWALRARVVTR